MWVNGLILHRETLSLRAGKSLGKKQIRDLGQGVVSTIPFCLIWSPYRVCLVLPTVEFMTVVEDVLVSRVEAGFHTILHHLASSRRALEFLHLEGGRRAWMGKAKTGSAQEVTTSGFGFKETL